VPPVGGHGFKALFVTVPKGHGGSCKVFVVVSWGCSSTYKVPWGFSGLLSPYTGCSLRNYQTGHSELEALTDYLLCYTEQVVEPEFVEQGLFSKAGGEWVALTSRATSRTGKHSQTWSRV
jgi:hypothetical protein